ncbi:unnamed protein product [Closterium sp. Naga37s-1]|nr:unnamed protein product [Closterium sp. Naga37s-1]
MHVDPNTSLAAQRVLAAHKAKHLHVEVDSPSGVPSHGGNSGGAIVTGEGPEFREPAQQQQQQLPPIQAQAQAVPGEGATVPQPLLSKSGRPVVRCQWCSQMLAVPPKLEPRDGVQKLRCGKCLKISKFSVFVPPAGGVPVLMPLSASGPLPGPPSVAVSRGGAQNQQPLPVQPQPQLQPPPQQQQGQVVSEETWLQQPLQGVAPLQAYQQQPQFQQPQGMGPVQPQQARQPSPQLMQQQQQQQQQQQHAALQGYGQGAQGLVQQMGGLSMGESFSQQPYAMAPQMPQGIGPQGGMQQGMGQQGMGQQGIGQQGMGQQGMGQQGMGQVYQQQAHAPGHMQAHPQQQQAVPQFQQQMVGGVQQQYANFAQPGMAGPGGFIPQQQQQQQLQHPHQQQQHMQFQQMQNQPIQQQMQQQVMHQGQGQGQQQMGHLAPPHASQSPVQASGFAASPLSQNHSPSMPMYHQNSGPPQQQQPLHPYQQQSPMQGRSHMGKVAYGHQAPRPPLSGGSIGGHLESEEGLPRQGSGKRFPKQPPQPPMDPQAATRRYLTGPGKSLAASIGFRSGSLNEHQMQQQQQHGGAGMGAPADLPFRRTATEYSGPPGRADAMTVAPRSSTLGGEGQYRRKVYMNGQPVPDKLVFLAERRIGTIEPGSYWYDCRAGFWGPVGGPAFGVTPAFMREFGMQPMQSDCSGGKTKVFVNGRELHKKDLVTLMKRGFPDTPGARYTLDADGTVCNEAGRHLFAMGKLLASLLLRARKQDWPRPGTSRYAWLLERQLATTSLGDKHDETTRIPLISASQESASPKPSAGSKPKLRPLMPKADGSLPEAVKVAAKACGVQNPTVKRVAEGVTSTTPTRVFEVPELIENDKVLPDMSPGVVPKGYIDPVIPEVWGRVHSIESFSAVDGPAIRSVVFVQGCLRRCVFCANPDTWSVTAKSQRLSSKDIAARLKKNLAYYKGGGGARGQQVGSIRIEISFGWDGAKPKRSR